MGGPLLRRKLSQRAPIFDRHDLAELRQIGVPVLKDSPRPGRAGVARVVGDQLMQALGVEPAHVAHHVDPPVSLQIAARMQMAQHHLFLGGHRLELDHRQVAALGECPGLVEHVGDAARHAGGEIAARSRR